jgi:ABC-type Fe3+/spermidine/putrescine transport system ATPase subunit
MALASAQRNDDMGRGRATGSGPLAASRAVMGLERVSKTYPGQSQPAVNELSLDIMQGEIFSLLGPSGCGKTTTLRMVAGLETPDLGVIRFGDTSIFDAGRGLCVPPEKREVGMVFQSYAIWPHMTVRENIGYPLKVKGCSRKQIDERVSNVLHLVGMGHLAERSAVLLSGGQQQRIALARALVYEPAFLLLDEPFSNLDAKLRENMRMELKLLQAKLKLTVLFVTHDQVEALSLSSRMAILDHGHVQQIGTPRQLYEKPVNEIVRDFLGSSVMLTGACGGCDQDGRVGLRIGGALGEVRVERPDDVAVGSGTEMVCSVRPEDIAVFPGHELPESAATASLCLQGVVEASLFTGDRTEYRIRISDQNPVLVYGRRRDSFKDGASVTLAIPLDCLRLWPKR